MPISTGNSGTSWSVVSNYRRLHAFDKSSCIIQAKTKYETASVNNPKVIIEMELLANSSAGLNSEKNLNIPNHK